MKRVIKFISLFLICITLFSPVLGCNRYEKKTERLSFDELAAGASISPVIANEMYYGRYALSQMSNSTALLYAYDKIVEGIASSASEISIYNGRNAISPEETKTVLDAYRRDHVEHFWIGTYYEIGHTDKTAKTLAPTYTMSGNELENAKREFENTVASMLSGITPAMTEYEKELYLHDKLAAKVRYIQGSNAHDAYGALVKGEAVCEGYAEAFQYLLQRAGIQSFIIIGKSKNPSANGDYESHAWNAVKINGKYYHVDLTWNDQDSHLFHAYFNQPTSVITADHEIEVVDYQLPQCTSSEADYFKANDTYLSSYTANSIATLLKNNGYTISVYLPSGADTFLLWVQDNISDIADAADARDAGSYMTMKLGNEVVLSLNVCKHLHMTYVPEDPASCTKIGNIAYYTCDDCNKLFSDSAGSTEIVNIFSVITDPLPHTYTEKIQNNSHLKYTAENCQKVNCYWYNCKDCTANAKNDPVATDKWYESDISGEHDIDITKWGHKTENGHAHACKTAGCDDHSTIAPHISSGSATETKPEICTECGYIITPALNHTSHTPSTEWFSDSKHHWHKCIGCEEQIFDETEHEYSQNCDSTCDICGKERQAEHTFSDALSFDGKSHWVECECGEKTNITAHTDIDKNGKCDDCGVNVKLNNIFTPFKDLIKKYAPLLVIALPCVLLSITVIYIVIKVGKATSNKMKGDK